MWRALRERAVGRVRLVYAEMDDGLVHRMPYRQWQSTNGLPWPYRDEFEVGCTLEHAGYVLTWLAMWFGPALSVSVFASTQVEDKLPAGEAPLDMDSPDFSVACTLVADHDALVRIEHAQSLGHVVQGSVELLVERLQSRLPARATRWHSCGTR